MLSVGVWHLEHYFSSKNAAMWHLEHYFSSKNTAMWHLEHYIFRDYYRIELEDIRQVNVLLPVGGWVQFNPLGTGNRFHCPKNYIFIKQALKWPRNTKTSLKTLKTCFFGCYKMFHWWNTRPRNMCSIEGTMGTMTLQQSAFYVTLFDKCMCLLGKGGLYTSSTLQ